jgi:DNA helicase II / ATP-dependent DNA helicase PcrA
VVEVIPSENEDQEASTVVALLNQLLTEGHPDIDGEVTPARCAALGRSKFAFRSLEEALIKSELKFYKKLSAANLQSESEVMEQFELAMRILANPHDRLHLGLLSRVWKTTKTADDIHSTYLDDARAIMILDTSDWRKHWNFYVRSEPGGSHSVSSFLGQVALGTTQQPNEPGIALLTVHSSKGMEFDVVILIGMTEGTFPDYRAKGPALEEEARSAFVAMTRSKRFLYLTYPKFKMMPWGDLKQQQPSRYVRLLTD